MSRMIQLNDQPAILSFRSGSVLINQFMSRAVSLLVKVVSQKGASIVHITKLFVSPYFSISKPVQENVAHWK